MELNFVEKTGHQNSTIKYFQVKTIYIILLVILASELVVWLQKNVENLENRVDCENFASNLMREGYIIPCVNKDTFTKETFYKFNVDFTGELVLIFYKKISISNF